MQASFEVALEPEAAARSLRATGYCLAHGTTEAELRACLSDLGEILQETDVTPKPGRALVTSRRALDLHTDHHRAEIVAWFCRIQAEDGGETLLADARAAYDRLAPGEQVALGKIRLYEHRVFEGDPEDYPLVEDIGGQPRFYFSYWFHPERLGPGEAHALARFKAALRESAPVQVRLLPGDSLLVMNRRILHGRTAINGTAARFLRRFWVSCKHGLAI